jgi:hypothetical protein
MPALREIAAVFGVRFDDAQLKKGVQSIDAAVSLLGKLGGALAGSQLAHSVVGFANDFADAAREIRASATTLRVSTDELQSARAGLAVAGLTAQEAAGTFAVFHRNVRAAATGGGDAGAAFWRLGIRLRDSQRVVRSSSDLLDEVAARFERIQHPERRARLAVQLFGDAGLRLLPSGADDIVLGVTPYDASLPPLGSIPGYAGAWAAGITASILRKGRIWVLVEQDVDPTLPVYVRYSASGGNTTLGKFRVDADSSHALQLAPARWLTTTTAGSLALLEVNIP